MLKKIKSQPYTVLQGTTEPDDFKVGPVFFGTNPLEDYAIMGILEEDLLLNNINISSSIQRNEVTDKIAETTQSLLSNFQNQSLLIIADELITNSFNHSKATPLSVVLNWIFDTKSKSIIIRITDNGGRLSLKHILGLFIDSEDQLVVKPQQSSPGAGLGLYFCREFCTEMLFVIDENTQTQITCVIPNRPRKNPSKLMVWFNKTN